MLPQSKIDLVRIFLVHRIWLPWTEPSNKVSEVGDRRSARLLASLLLVVLPLGLISAGIQLFTVESFSPTFFTIIGALLALGGIYQVCRTAYYRIAGVFASLIPIAAGAVVGFISPHDPAWFAFMGLGTLLASAFLSARTVSVLGVLTVVLTLVVLVHGDAFSDKSNGVPILSFALIYSALITLVTQHRAAVDLARQTEIRDSQALYRILFENAPLGIAVVTLEGNIVALNQAMPRLGGYTREDLEQLPDMVDLLYDAHTQTRLLNQLEKNGRVVGLEVRMRAKDGTPYDTALSIEYITFERRRCMLVIAEDIADRKRAERERTELLDYVEKSLDELYLFDTDSLRFEYANEGALQNVGYSMEQLRLLTPVDLMPEFSIASLRRLIDPLLQGAIESLVFETIHRRANTTLYPVEVHLHLAKRSGHTALLAVVLDITARKEAEREKERLSQQLLEQEQQFLQAQKMETVGRLAGGIAHDFNNLLTVIDGTAALAGMDLAEDAPIQQELKEIRRAGERATALTRQLLAFSRKQILQPAVVNLNTIVTDVTTMLQRVIGEHIELVIVQADGLANVKADPGQIEQVIANLAVNARDAMPNGGTLQIETQNMTISMAQAQSLSIPPGRYVRLLVTDTGTGMDEATSQRIFEPFFTTKEVGLGTGLGLSTVYGIVKQSGGSIAVSSELGKGSMFEICLPQVEEAAHPTQSTVHADIRQGTETILIVEDEEAIRRMAARLLGSAGYRILTAANGEEALLLLEQHPSPIHLMFTDIVMPGMSGLELATRVKRYTNMKVLFTSGFTSDAARLLEEGALFIEKPYSIIQLTHKVRELLDTEADSA